MLISVLAFTIMNTIVKQLKSVTPHQLVFFRALGSVILCVGYLKFKKINLVGTQQKLLFARGVLGTVSMFFFFLTVKEIPFGSAVSLRYVAPIFAGIFAIILLKEKITFVQWCCFFTAFLGVFILKGFDSRITITGLVYVSVSALFSGLVYVLIRKIGKREHPVVIVLYFMFCAMTLGGIVSIFDWKSPTLIDWWLLASLGIFGFIGQVFMTKAYQTASIGIVAPMKYIESVFAILFGWIWFQESYTLITLVGLFLIIGSMLVNMLTKK